MKPLYLTERERALIDVAASVITALWLLVFIVVLALHRWAGWV